MAARTGRPRLPTRTSELLFEPALTARLVFVFYDSTPLAEIQMDDYLDDADEVKGWARRLRTHLPISFCLVRRNGPSPSISSIGIEFP